MTVRNNKSSINENDDNHNSINKNNNSKEGQ